MCTHARYLGCVQFFATPWIVAHQAPLSGIFQARMLEWGAFPPPGNLPKAVIKLASPALACRFFTTEPPRMPEVRLKENHHHRIAPNFHLVF